MGEHPDAGMRAVARVRGVREQDSRLGLRRATSDEREAVRRLEVVTTRLAETAETAPTDGDLAGFLLTRASAQAMAAEAARARDALARARTIATEAHSHWQRDKTRLSAVELLLERRAQERRAERARRELVEIDDLVSARWIRLRHGGGTA